MTALTSNPGGTGWLTGQFCSTSSHLISGNKIETRIDDFETFWIPKMIVSLSILFSFISPKSISAGHKAILSLCFVIFLFCSSLKIVFSIINQSESFLVLQKSWIAWTHYDSKSDGCCQDDQVCKLSIEKVWPQHNWHKHKSFHIQIQTIQLL